jgi:hypothetical protein
VRKDFPIVTSTSIGEKNMVKEKDTDVESILIRLVYNCTYLKRGKCDNGTPQQCCYSCKDNEKCFKGVWENIEEEKCKKGLTRCYRYRKWRDGEIVNG